MTPLTLLFEDDRFVAVDKPAGMAVHRSGHVGDAGPFAVQTLRDQIGRHVWPVHRLDRPTSGVVVFALDREAAGRLSDAFAERRVVKTYHAIVRGFVTVPLDLDRPLSEREAHTRVAPLGTVELAHAVGRYPTARYSLVEVTPTTGRLHQIRRHLAGAGHPIVGDVGHGDRHHNHFFRDVLGVERLLLHALALRWPHPFTGAAITTTAPVDAAWQRALEALGV